MYQVASSKAEEFIHDGEIVETLAYARENRANRPLIEAILQKAAEGKGVTHREAAVLLECELEDLNQRMFTLAKQIKEKIYGNRIVMFAPSICRTTASTAAYIARTTRKTKPFRAASSPRRKSAAR